MVDSILFTKAPHDVGSISATKAIHDGSRLLRVAAIGSVDDGKSTLIGRLLHDTKQLFDDQMRALVEASRRRGLSGMELAFVTDGLRAEREQGITIDVAYRYAVTATRTLVIADCPGHVEYTRNMATGASTADVAVMVIDVQKGVRQQTRRHLVITSFLGVKKLIVVANKMDLVDWSEERFQVVAAELRSLAQRLAFDDVCIIPASALYGENVVVRASAHSWYHGPTLIEQLEAIPASAFLDAHEHVGPRFPVQWICRKPGGGRSYAGIVIGAPLSVGDGVKVLPKGTATTIEAMRTADQELTNAPPGYSIMIDLSHDVDAARGDMILPISDAHQPVSTLDATVLWFAEKQLHIGDTFLLKHTTKTTVATVQHLEGIIDVDAVSLTLATTIGLNDIGRVTVMTADPIVSDMYTDCRATGSFLIIDRQTSATLGCGLIGPLPQLR